jgi:hypothetical protein
MSELSSDLTRLGAALEAAAAADVLRRWRPSRRLVAIAVSLVLLIPAAAIGAAHLIRNSEVEASLPAGAFILVGTQPRCTTVRPGVEYRCVLDRAPYHMVDDFTGVVYQTVDASRHVNGGCRSLQADGLVWECYLGEEAVRQNIISEDFLGAVQNEPAHG